MMQAIADRAGGEVFDLRLPCYFCGVQGARTLLALPGKGSNLAQLVSSLWLTAS